jgi:hypothetical protein
MPVSKSKKPANPVDVQKQLETIVGHKIEVTAEQIKTFRYAVGAHDYTDGTILWISIIFPGRSCIPSTLLDASGVSSSGTDEKRVFLLSDFVRLPQLRSLAEPINVLATARSTSPFFLTTAHALVNNATDAEITVFAWDAKGAPAPNVAFDWRCRVVSNQIIG